MAGTRRRRTLGACLRESTRQGGPVWRQELAEANGAVQIVGHVRTLGGAEAALRALRPSVLVLDPELAHRDGLRYPRCGAHRPEPRSSCPRPASRDRGPTRRSAGSSEFERRRDGDGLTLRERDVVRLVAPAHEHRDRRAPVGQRPDDREAPSPDSGKAGSNAARGGGAMGSNMDWLDP